MSALEITVENRSRHDLDIERYRDLGAVVLGELGAGAGELGIIFVPPREIGDLNREHLGREGPTDVISFPIDVPEAGADAREQPLLLGDVVICPDVARDNAGAFGVSLDEELCRLVIHGILHVRGFDHESDDGRMAAREEELVAGHCR